MNDKNLFGIYDELLSAVRKSRPERGSLVSDLPKKKQRRSLITAALLFFNYLPAKPALLCFSLQWQCVFSAQLPVLLPSSGSTVSEYRFHILP